MQKKPLIAGNWKMNKTLDETSSFFNAFLGYVDWVEDRDILICPPFVSLRKAAELAEGTNVFIGAQNMHFEEKGAFTGEISPLMVKSAGCRYVILGHSERRHVFNEKDELINRKVKAALHHGIIPILCVGETLEERDKGKAKAVVEHQIKEGLKGVSKTDIQKIVIAYEPVWAIGTGKNATPQEAQEMHLFIRLLMKKLFKEQACKTLRILYGGSVNPENINAIMSMKDIDGVLVGGASLNPDSFAKIVKFGKN